MNLIKDRFPLAEAIAADLGDDIEALIHGNPSSLLDRVTPITRELLTWWFQEDYVAVRGSNFHEGQRDAILAIIYAHEVLGTTTLLDLYEKVARDAVLVDGRLGEVTSERNKHPKYAAKMATGTGKTWVLNALLVWQHLNAIRSPDDPRFTSNFLIVAPGLIVYDRLLDSFLGKVDASGDRDFLTSDIAQQSELFIPDNLRAAVLGFIQSSVVTKYDIGRKITGSGVIAIANWHVLAGQDPEVPDFMEIEEIETPGADIDERAAAASFIPLSPGTSTGNSLDVLDRRFGRGDAMQWLVDLPSLLVFNDEAHHVHSKKGEEDSEVEWQRSLNELAAGKGRRFVQVDFSATPYNESRGKKIWFPHIVVDFDLMQAISSGLVKSLVLDKRQEVAALKNDDLNFSAERDDKGKVTGLSNGQRVMLSAGLAKLKILEKEFEAKDAEKHPKLLIMVEDTTVSPLVEEFLLSTGLAKEDVLRVDSGRKQELGPKEWEPLRDQLFSVDSLKSPKVIISVLMLREGFDVNNICVIVPLRAATSGILAEQTVGRGLRLMWRGEPAIDELKARNRQLISQRKAPESYFDVLFVVEHPRFDSLYDELLSDGLMGEVDGESGSPVGDLERVELRPDYPSYDFVIPFVIRDSDEELVTPRVDIAQLPVSIIPLSDLLGFVKQGDTFVSQELTTKVQFGAFTVDGAKMSSSGYNDFLSKLAGRVGGAISRSFTSAGVLKQSPSAEAVLQVQRPVLVSWADRYIRTRFFGPDFDPLLNEQWRVLMIDDIADQLAGNLAAALLATLETQIVGEPEVRERRLSEVSSLMIRSSSAITVAKCIYPKLPLPAHGGGLERMFVEWADSDAQIEALVKIHEYKHDFLRRPYLKADGMPAQYSPDFLVRTAHEIYVVETKAQSAMSDANVRRKMESARGWCVQINELPEELRSGREWHYVLLGEKAVREWRDRGMPASQLLDYSRLRAPQTSTHTALF
ncbi:MAG TPA: DEAD/DEAH box helicase family protein [Pseudolysinimonas sp.]|nr:DEAD/DEAH box helicase family protein [Pseudolysinimonas sp.]